MHFNCSYKNYLNIDFFLFFFHQQANKQAKKQTSSNKNKVNN